MPGVCKYAFNVTFYCVLLSAYSVKAQSIAGLVTDDKERLSGAIIANLHTHVMVTSDIRGGFNIKVQNGDTIITSKEYYKTDTLVYTQQDYLLIRLTQTIRALAGVTIKDSLSTPLSVYNQNKKDYKDIYWKGDKSHMFTVGVGTMAGIGVNIDKVYNALSKQGKDARRLQRNLTSDYRNSVIDRRFNKNLVGRITGYKGEKLDNFMVKNRPTFEFANKATDYEIIQYIKKKLQPPG